MEDESKIVFKTKVSRNIYRVLFESNLENKKNDLFLPNRMAYIVDLNDEETDIPITSIRSKAECPSNENNLTLTTNDIVINKLTQIIAYLRHGKRNKKNVKKVVSDGGDVNQLSGPKRQVDQASASLGIYDDIGDYVPEITKKKETEQRKSLEPVVKKNNYFGIENEEVTVISLLII